MPTWASAFSAALLVALVTVARCRRLATTIGFVDVPDSRKSHVRAIPYLGGVGLILGVLAGLVFEYPIGSKVMLILLAATILGTIGLVDDDRTVSPVYRFGAEVVAAAIATAAGLRIHATGIQPFDVAITMLWIVGITNALNLLDNMDGLAAGLTSVAATAVFALAVAAEQPVIATLAAATVGACIGFLVFNRPPASIFMGDSGSLFLGFLLAVVTIDVDSALTTPTNFLIPLMVLAVPILDTTMVTIGRLRRRRSVFIGGRDHLSHRLVAAGRTPRRAVVILLAVETVVAAMAVVAGRRIIPVSWAAAATVVILGGLVWRTAQAPVYLEPVVGFPPWLRKGLLGLVIALPLLAAPAALALAKASKPARAGAEAAVDALRALERGDADLTASTFKDARAKLKQAQDRLSGPLVTAGMVVPGLSSNLRAARTLVDIGYELAGQGALLANAYAAETVTVSNGAVPLGEIAKLAPLLEDAQRLLNRSKDRISDINTGFVLHPLARAVDDARIQLDKQSARSDTVVQMAKILPAILGGDGPRRYFLAFQNNAELRGSGGFMGNWGELIADQGRVRIVKFGRQDDLINGHAAPLTLQGMDDFLTRWREFELPNTWQQVNVSPDFPTTAEVISQLYPQSGGDQIDGVIAIDPFGLASILNLTGPVTVPGWDGLITSTNLVDVTLHQAYERFRQDLRVEFLGDVAEKVSQALTTTNIGSPTKLGAALGNTTRQQHVKVWLSRPNEEKLMQELGADGALRPLEGDSLMVVDQNLAANKIDYYLNRSIYYNVTLQPSSTGRTAHLTGHLQVAMENHAPPSGQPSVVIGPYDNRFKAGENWTYMSVYTPFALRSATVDGAPPETPVVTDADAGRLAHSLTVKIPASTVKSVDMDVSGDIQLSEDGWYRLDVLRQPTVHADHVEASISVPSGWEIVETRNATPTGPRTAVFKNDITAPSTIWVRVARAGLAKYTDRLLHRS